MVFAAAVMMVAFVGCKGKDGGAAAPAAKKVEVPESAADVAKLAEKALKEGDVATVWQLALPESYRKDIQSLVDEVKKVDAELYNKAMGLVPKAVAALEKNAAMLEGAPVKLDDIKAFAKILGDAGLLTHEGLQKFNVDNFIAAHGKTLYTMGKAAAGEEAAIIDQMSLSVEDEKDGKATLLVKVGESVEKIAFVKEGNAWVAEELKAGWAEGLAQAKTQIAEGLKMAEGEGKAQAMAMLQMVETTLDSGDLSALGGMIPGM
jgi:hypothetical protein